MGPLKLDSPLPRPIQNDYSEFVYPYQRSVRLPEPEAASNISIQEILNRRSSSRTFGILSAQDISNILWHTSRNKITKFSPDRGIWQHRLTPSAGGIHPIDILIIDRRKHSPRCGLYSGPQHAIIDLKVPEKELLSLIDHMSASFPLEEGTIFLHCAQPARLFSQYSEAESLLWRDAGALVGTTYFVAAAYGLACCALGATGEPFLSKMLNSGAQAVGVGACVLGSVSEDNQ